MKLVGVSFGIWAVPDSNFMILVSRDNGVVRHEERFDRKAANAKACALRKLGGFENEDVTRVEACVEETTGEGKRRGMVRECEGA